MDANVSCCANSRCGAVPARAFWKNVLNVGSNRFLIYSYDLVPREINECLKTIAKRPSLSATHSQ